MRVIPHEQSQRCRPGRQQHEPNPLGIEQKGPQGKPDYSKQRWLQGKPEPTKENGRPVRSNPEEKSPPRFVPFVRVLPHLMFVPSVHLMFVPFVRVIPHMKFVPAFSDLEKSICQLRPAVFLGRRGRGGKKRMIFLENLSLRQTPPSLFEKPGSFFNRNQN